MQCRPQFEGALRTPGWHKDVVILFVCINNFSVPDSTTDKTSLESVTRPISIIGGGRGQWLGGTMASAEHETMTGVWGQSPQLRDQRGEAP